MFQALLIGFREGLEAFLIIAIAALYLRKIGHPQLLAALRWGVVTALATCAALGVWMARLGELSPVWAGGMALLAAAAVLWCVAHMAHAGPHIAQDIRTRLDELSARQGLRAWWAVFAFTLFMISREGVEAATMIASLASNAQARDMAWGGVLGVGLAGAVSLLWVRYGHRVQLGRLLQVTAWFMAAFGIQLVLYAVHEFSEAGVVPGVDNAQLHLLTEDVAEGWIAQVLAVAMVVVPSAWLIAAHWRDARGARASHPARS